MFQVLSPTLWTNARRAANGAHIRKAAVAYVTKDLIGFRKGDVLVANASMGSISTGATDAKLLLKLYRKGVRLYNCPHLHAKVFLLGDVALIGSGNLSQSSEKHLVEAGLLTDHGPAVSGVDHLIDQLVQKSEPLKKADLEKLRRIKVVKKDASPFASSPKPKIEPLQRTWLAGVWEDSESDDEATDQWVKKQTEETAKETGYGEDQIDWIEWGKSGSVVSKAKPNDRLILISRETKKDTKPTAVLKATPLLRKCKRKGVTYLFILKPEGKKPEVSWPAFQKLLKRLGERPASKDSERLLS